MYNGCGPCSELVIHLHVYVIHIIVVCYHGNHSLRIIGNGLVVNT